MKKHQLNLIALRKLQKMERHLAVNEYTSLEEHVCQFRNGFDFPNFSNDADKPQSCWSRILTDMPQQQNHSKEKQQQKHTNNKVVICFLKGRRLKTFLTINS
jgi:hypothetical protein